MRGEVGVHELELECVPVSRSTWPIELILIVTTVFAGLGRMSAGLGRVFLVVAAASGLLLLYTLWERVRSSVVARAPYAVVFGREGITVDGRKVRFHDPSEVALRDGFLKFGDQLLYDIDPAKVDVAELQGMVGQVLRDQRARRLHGGEVPEDLTQLERQER